MGTTGKKAVGEQIYVFSKQLGQQYSKKCLLQAHAAQRLCGNTLNRKFTVPIGMTLSFFAPHGSTLFCSFDDCANSKKRQKGVVERITGGMQCYDYDLSKQIGYHADSITGCATIDKLINHIKGGQNMGMSYHDVEQAMASPLVDTDIMTIRNRWTVRGMTLSRAIQEIAQAGYRYNEIFCQICRGPAIISRKTIKNCGTPIHQL